MSMAVWDAVPRAAHSRALRWTKWWFASFFLSKNRILAYFRWVFQLSHRCHSSKHMGTLEIKDRTWSVWKCCCPQLTVQGGAGVQLQDGMLCLHVSLFGDWSDIEH